MTTGPPPDEKCGSPPKGSADKQFSVLSGSPPKGSVDMHKTKNMITNLKDLAIIEMEATSKKDFFKRVSELSNVKIESFSDM